MFFMQFSTFVVIIITNTVYIAVIEYTYRITHTALIGLVNIKSTSGVTYKYYYFLHF